jgi:hypothetical protein
MRTSSARQIELPGLSITDTLAEGGSRQSEFITGGKPPIDAAVTTFMPLSAPSGGYGSAYAVNSRLLGRLNTTMVKPAEYEGLLKERQALLDKKFDGTMTRVDENRLEYVRWSLGRIQDARSGPALDALESMVAGYQQFLGDMRNFEQQLRDATQPSKKARR